MTSHTKKHAHARKSLLTGASALAAAAAAIVGAPATAQEVEEEEAIVVTGTRLVRQDFEAISPVTTIGAEQIEMTATMSTETLLNELPQIVPNSAITSNNAGGEDFATLDLRGLNLGFGTQRTLILVNGERIPASSPTGAIDVNTIPASLISRVEVVTGGASAVYGSDAIAGVVNFVLKDDYEGAEVNVTYGSELETGNAQEFEINGLVGGNFANGRGNMTAYASYYDRNKVLQSEYDYSRVSGAVCYNIDRGADNAYFICDTAAEAAANEAAGGFNNPSLLGGAPAPAWGWIANNGGHRPGPDGAYGTGDDVITGNPFNPSVLNGGITAAQFTSYDHDCNPATANISYGDIAGAGLDGIPGTADDVFAGQATLSFNDAGNLEPRNINGACFVPDRAAGSSYYNFAPDNFLVLPAERVALSTSGHYDITDSVRLNVLINYANSRTEVQLAPTPASGLAVTLTPNMRNLIQANAPDLWAALQSRPNPYAPFSMDRRFNEVGTRNSLFENNSFFLLTGLEGSLGENWDWNLSASYGQVLFNTRAINSVNATALRQGLAGCQTLLSGPDLVLNTADDTGAPLGTSGLPGCVPVDIFGPGTLTDDMVSFIRVNTFTDNIVEENRVTGFVRGDLFELPAGPIASVFGFEYRDSYAGQFNDNEQRSGNIFGFNAIQDQEGSIDVYELYTEMAIPLISEQAFAHYLGLELGFRRSNYSSVGNVDTYKIGGEWAPAEWLRFRAVFNEATRAPNVFELFRAGDQGFQTTQDPCRDTNPANGVPDVAGVTQAECLATGIPAGFYPGFAQQAQQLQVFAFGNPNLRPETAETFTYGMVFQPDWFPLGDLRATVDAYDIEIADVVAALGSAFYLNDCYVNNVAASCARIHRDPSNGQLVGLGFGIDTSRANLNLLTTSGYDIQIEWSLPLGPGQLSVNELFSVLDSFQINGTEFAGTSSAGIGATTPEYKSTLSVNYGLGDWTVFGRWSYTPEVVSSPLNGFGVSGDAFAANPTVSPAASYIDLAVRWNMTSNFTLTANVDNIFDEYPPQTADGYTSQANTDPQVYRVLGWTFAVSGRYRF